MQMIVPDEARRLISSFPVPPDMLLGLWDFLDQDIPNSYPVLRGNRPADFFHEGFFVAQTFWLGNVSHTFCMFVDDASATDCLFLRDIQHDTWEHNES